MTSLTNRAHPLAMTTEADVRIVREILTGIALRRQSG